MVKTVARFQLAVLMSTAAVFASSAEAAGPDGSGVYLGIGAGVGHASIDEGNINASLASLGLTNPSTTADQSSVAYKLFLGYSFNRYIAIEGGYFNLGKFSFDSTVTGPGTLSGEVKTYGFNFDAVASLPLTQTFSIFGRGGVQNAKSTVNYTSTGSVTPVFTTSQTSETKTSWDAGAGAAFEFANGKVGVRVEWTLYRVPDGTDTNNKSNINVYGLSVYSKF